MSLINFIIVVLFIIYIVCAWNSTKEFENNLLRISFILVGTLFITLLTLILFWISKIGVQYPIEYSHYQPSRKQMSMIMNIFRNRGKI